MSSKIKNLGQCSIDSMKLRLELSSLKAFDQSLKDYLYIVNESTGDIEKEYKRQSKKYLCNGFSVYASIQENFLVSKDTYSDCLILLINSKQLGSKYFDGITLKTIPLIHDLLRELKILDCSLETFLKGKPTDIDFKKDFELIFDEYQEMIKALKKMTKQSSNRDKGYTHHKGQSNNGISWSVRKSNKYLSSPYTKIYHKGLEMHLNGSKGGSNEFREIYLPYLDITNVFRLETTVKNKKHLESLKLGLKSFSLEELLNLSKASLDKIMSTAFNSHLLPRNPSLTFKSKKKMSPSDQQLFSSLLAFIHDHEYSLNRAINLMTGRIESPVAKSRAKKKLTIMYNDEISGTNYQAKSSKIESVFDAFGWA